MILLLDSGNSRLKLALLVQDASGTWQYAGEPVALAHDTVAAGLPAWLATQTAALAKLARDVDAGQALGSTDRGLLPDAVDADTGRDPATGIRLQRALGVNVAGAVAAQRIADTLAPYGIDTVEWQVPGAETLGLRNGYRTPAQLGADRWMGLVGIWTSATAGTAPRPRQLVNFGTATTVDTVSPDGEFVGGLIVPGWNLMRDALAQRTAQLPTAAGTVRDFPTDTHDAITSGIAAAQAGAVLRQWMIARARFGTAPALYITGGASAEVLAEIAQLLALADVTAPLQRVAHPVIDGLLAVLQHRLDQGADASLQQDKLLRR